MNSLSIQFYIKIGEGNSVQDENGNSLYFEDIISNSVDGFLVDVNEKDLMNKYEVFLNTYYPNYDLIEPVFEVFSEINGKRDKTPIDILEDFDEDFEIESDEVDISVIQEWIDEKLFIRNNRIKKFDGLLDE